MKLDRSGIEKANWGGFFRNLFCKVRKVPSGGEDAPPAFASPDLMQV